MKKKNFRILTSLSQLQHTQNLATFTIGFDYFPFHFPFGVSLFSYCDLKTILLLTPLYVSWLE